MLYTKSSKDVIGNIPINKILLESDAPLTSQNLSRGYYDSLTTQIANLREEPKEPIAQAIFENSQKIFK